MITSPKPIVHYGGSAYTLCSSLTPVPDLHAMPRLAALVWLNRNAVRSRG